MTKKFLNKIIKNMNFIKIFIYIFLIFFLLLPLISLIKLYVIPFISQENLKKEQLILANELEKIRNIKNINILDLEKTFETLEENNERLDKIKSLLIKFPNERIFITKQNEYVYVEKKEGLVIAQKVKILLPSESITVNKDLKIGNKIVIKNIGVTKDKLDTTKFLHIIKDSYENIKIRVGNDIQTITLPTDYNDIQIQWPENSPGAIIFFGEKLEENVKYLNKEKSKVFIETESINNIPKIFLHQTKKQFYIYTPVWINNSYEYEKNFKNFINGLKEKKYNILNITFSNNEFNQDNTEDIAHYNLYFKLDPKIYNTSIIREITNILEKQKYFLHIKFSEISDETTFKNLIVKKNNYLDKLKYLYIYTMKNILRNKYYEIIEEKIIDNINFTIENIINKENQIYFFSRKYKNSTKNTPWENIPINSGIFISEQKNIKNKANEKYNYFIYNYEIPYIMLDNSDLINQNQSKEIVFIKTKNFVYTILNKGWIKIQNGIIQDYNIPIDEMENSYKKIKDFIEQHKIPKEFFIKFSNQKKIISTKIYSYIPLQKCNIGYTKYVSNKKQENDSYIYQFNDIENNHESIIHCSFDLEFFPEFFISNKIIESIEIEDYNKNKMIFKNEELEKISKKEFTDNNEIIFYVSHE